MSVFRYGRLGFLAVFALCLIVALGACSKKDVVEGDPAISPSGDAGAAAAPSGESVGTEGAGDASAGSNDFQAAFFDYDSYRLRADARESLKANAEWLKNNPNATVQVEGHCDERGTTEYNLALGERRANAARDYLVKLGVDKSRISVISYGEERPVDPGHDEAAWSQNRRAQFVLLSQ